ncbi:MAG: FMN-binding protein [Prevotella sp.]|nr:FMN-binding protein [Prevotella sp.]MBO7539044.1 FMN-binding protein [Prevotella sp.]
MKLNTNSNSYIIIYSAILVVIVAFLLAFVYKALKPMQDRNVELDRKIQVLYSLNIRNLDGAEAEAKYKEVIEEESDFMGNELLIAEIDGETLMVYGMKGMGLWGGISGYMSVRLDPEKGGFSVYGAYFNHESETAGLGAEIKDSQEWQEKFIGKRIFDEDCKHVVLSVVKKVEDPECQVDCVTGATLTSNGVDEMIKKTFGLWTGEYDLDMDESELKYQFLKSVLSGSDISDAELKKMIKVKKVEKE